MTTTPPQDSAPQDAGAPDSTASRGTSAPGAAPGTDLGADIGAALNFAWQGLARTPGALLGSGAIYFVLIIVGTVVGIIAMLTLSIGVLEATSAGEGATTVVTLLLSLVLIVGVAAIAALWQAAAANAAGLLADGVRPTFRQSMHVTGRVATTAVLVLVLILLGSVLLYVPGLIAAVALFHAIPAALRGASPGEALRESVATTRAHLGTTVVGFLVLTVASYVGSMVIVGMIAVIPFTVLLQLGLYERVNGRALPEPARA